MFNWTVLVIVVSIVAGISSRYIFKKDDHPIEELAEKIVKDKTGVNVDFTPESKEDDEKS